MGVGTQLASPFLLHLFPLYFLFFFHFVPFLHCTFWLSPASQPCSACLPHSEKRVAYPLGALLFSCRFALLSLLLLSPPVRVADLLEPCRCLPACSLLLLRCCCCCSACLPFTDYRTSPKPSIYLSDLQVCLFCGCSFIHSPISAPFPFSFLLLRVECVQIISTGTGTILLVRQQRKKPHNRTAPILIHPHPHTSSLWLSPPQPYTYAPYMPYLATHTGENSER